MLKFIGENLGIEIIFGCNTMMPFCKTVVSRLWLLKSIRSGVFFSCFADRASQINLSNYTRFKLYFDFRVRTVASKFLYSTYSIWCIERTNSMLKTLFEGLIVSKVVKKFPALKKKIPLILTTIFSWSTVTGQPVEFLYINSQTFHKFILILFSIYPQFSEAAFSLYNLLTNYPEL